MNVLAAAPSCGLWTAIAACSALSDLCPVRRSKPSAPAVAARNELHASRHGRTLSSLVRKHVRQFAGRSIAAPCIGERSTLPLWPSVESQQSSVVPLTSDSLGVIPGLAKRDPGISRRNLWIPGSALQAARNDGMDCQSHNASTASTTAIGSPVHASAAPARSGEPDEKNMTSSPPGRCRFAAIARFCRSGRNMRCSRRCTSFHTLELSPNRACRARLCSAPQLRPQRSFVFSFRPPEGIE